MKLSERFAAIEKQRCEKEETDGIDKDDQDELETVSHTDESTTKLLKLSDRFACIEKPNDSDNELRDSTSIDPSCKSGESEEEITSMEVEEELTQMTTDESLQPQPGSSFNDTTGIESSRKGMKLSERFAANENQRHEKAETDGVDKDDQDELETVSHTDESATKLLKLSDRFACIKKPNDSDNKLQGSTSIDPSCKSGESEEEITSMEVEDELAQTTTDESSQPQPGSSFNDTTDFSSVGYTDTADSTDTSENVTVSGEKVDHNTTPRNSTSPTTFLDYSDDDDDDDILHTAPAFLKSIQEITNQPSPTPSLDSSFNFNSGTDSACSSPVKIPDNVTLSSSVKPKFCLDSLLLEHNDQAAHNKEYNELKTQLKTDGGFINVLNKADDPSLEEVALHEDHEEILRQMGETEDEIPEDRPGVEVFSLDKIGCMFDNSLHPRQCGFTMSDNPSGIEKYVESITQDKFMMLVESDILCLCSSKIVCQSELLQWLFFIMSVDDNFLFRQYCNRTLSSIIHEQKTKKSKTWSPSITDFITVLCNCGASLNSLIPKPLEPTYNEELLRSRLLKQPQQRSKENVKDQLKMVLEILAVSLMNNKNAHSPKDLALYLAVLCKMALDPIFKDLFAITNLHQCVDMILHNYTDEDWERERVHLCRVLMSISSHHHDMTYIIDLLPEGTRGVYVQRRAAYLMLKSLLLGEDTVSDDQLHDLKIKDLYQFVPMMNTLFLEDLYLLSSVIALLDKCVASNYPLTSTDRSELRCFIELVKKLRVKDRIEQITRTKVKDMLTRVMSMWTLDLQMFTGKQTKIFDYADNPSPIKMKIEKLKLQSSDVSDDSLSDDDDQNLPCKISKLS